MDVGRLVLLRHGESEWNAKNLFTGWVDVGLTDKGFAEAVRAGELLAEHDLLPDVLHTSLLQARDRHGAGRARDVRPALDPGTAQLAAQRASLRRRCRARTRRRSASSTARNSS